MTPPSPLRAPLREAFAAAVKAAHPRHCLEPHLPAPPLSGRLIMLAAGKAAGSMVEIAERFYLDRNFPPQRLLGLGVTRHGYKGTSKIIETIEAGHPVPDESGLAATRRILALAASAGENDLVLVLLSGGGSANWIAPAGRLTLLEKQDITRALLRSGADIQELNTVRKHLSRIKGGRLAALARRARLLTLAISDVPHDDPTVIASGPTVADPSTLAQARAILSYRDIALPDAARDILNDEASETPKPGDAIFARTQFKIIARPADALAAAAATLAAKGFEPIVLGSDLEGEAREVAVEQARLALDLASQGRRAALVSGGELTVSVRGQGRGGPNQEFALALALALQGAPGIAALAADTDGTDGGSGSASDPAGAIVDDTTLRRAGEQGLDAKALLADNDSTRFFEELGDLVTPGPTQTNVNDCRIILVDRESSHA